MRYNQFFTKLHMVYAAEYCDRVQLIQVEGEDVLQVDLHALNCLEGKRFVQNIVKLCVAGTKIRVIHGYHHGVALKSMIQVLEHPRISGKKSFAYNPGMTELDIA